MIVTAELKAASQAVAKYGAFHGVDKTRLGLVADVQSRARELDAMREGEEISPAQVEYLQCLRQRLQDFCLQSFTVAQDWLDAFENAYSDLSTRPVPPVAYTVQDGEMFYIHTDPEGEVYVAFRQAPIHVEYYNTDDAAKARAWLVAEFPATQFHFI